MVLGTFTWALDMLLRPIKYVVSGKLQSTACAQSHVMHQHTADYVLNSIVNKHGTYSSEHVAHYLYFEVPLTEFA